MNRDELNALLSKLKSELASNQPVDAHLRQSLESLDEDIRKVLMQRPDEAAANDGEALLSERAQVIEARFAAEHPYLANTLRDVMDSLGKMGI